MTHKLHVRAIRRKQIDEDKLALAFLLLAKVLAEQEATEAADATISDGQPDDLEAA